MEEEIREGSDSDGENPASQGADRQKETTESEDTENKAQDVERDSDEEDGLNERTKRLRKTTESENMAGQADVEDFERKENNLLTDEPGLWPADFTDQDREIVVRKLALREKEVEMLFDSEEKPFFNYLKYTRAANE